MNIHPLIVHFPIAFLVVYALAELIRHRRLINELWWLNLKGFLVVVGTLGSYVAVLTGELAEQSYESSPLHNLVELHSMFAVSVVVLSTLLAGAYLLALTERYGWFKYLRTLPGLAGSIVRTKVRMGAALQRSWGIEGGALLLLALITVTGSLGAAIAHGPETDFVVSFIYQLFF